jgi:ABC-type sugar transport system ATPase subunit
MISHNLADVFAVADRVCVLRLGRNGGDFVVGEASEDEIVSAITGAHAGGGRRAGLPSTEALAAAKAAALPGSARASRKGPR